MHPEIKKFWEDAGYKITFLKEKNLKKDALNPDIYFFNHQHGQTRIIAILLNNGDMQYIFNDNCHFMDSCKYSEEEALRLVKLKMFI